MSIKNLFTKTGLATLIAIIGLAGCAPGADSTSSPATESVSQVASGGTLYLKVNPEIAVQYDEAGKVTNIKGENKDGFELITDFSDFEGKDAREVINELVTVIGEAGYFVEEVAGQKRKITIELERGSLIPSEAFLAEIVSDIRDLVNGKEWTAPVRVEGSTDYDDTNYGPNNDGITDYSAAEQPAAPTEPAASINDDRYTDYDDSDYGTPAPVSPAVPVTPPATNGDSGYSDYDDTDYDDSDYDDSDYGDSDYD